MPAYARELRPFRITTYVVFLVFTLTFIGLVIRSVAMDLYSRPPTQTGGQTSFTSCREQLELLNGRLQARLNTPLAPRAEKDWDAFKREWDTFTRSFEDTLRHIQAECVDRRPSGGGATAAPVIAEAAERLDALRQHLARCGEEGEAEREAVSVAFGRLRELPLSSEH